MKRNERIAALRARRNAMKENDELIDDAVNAAPAPQQVPMPAPVDGQQLVAPAADPAMQQPGPMNPLVPPQPGMIPTGWMFPNQSAQAVAMDTGDVNLAGAAPGGGVVDGAPVTNEEAQMIEEYRKYRKQKRLEKLATRLARKVKESSEEELEPEIPEEVSLDMPPEAMDDSAGFEDEEFVDDESGAVITADDLEDLVVDINKLFADAGGDLASVTSEDAFEDEEIAQKAEDAVKDELAEELEEATMNKDTTKKTRTRESAGGKYKLEYVLYERGDVDRKVGSFAAASDQEACKKAAMIQANYGPLKDLDAEARAELEEDVMLDFEEYPEQHSDPIEKWDSFITYNAEEFSLRLTAPDGRVLIDTGMDDFAEEEDFEESKKTSRKPRRKENRLVDELSEEEMDLGPEGLDDLEWDPDEEDIAAEREYYEEEMPADDEFDIDDVLDDMDPGNTIQERKTQRRARRKEAAPNGNAMHIRFPAGTPAPKVSADAADAAYKTLEPESSSIQAFEKKAATRRAVLAELRKQRNARRKENLMDADLSDADITQEDVIDEVIPGSNKSAILESRSFRPSEKFLESYREKQKLDYKAMLKQGLLG